MLHKKQYDRFTKCSYCGFHDDEMLRDMSTSTNFICSSCEDAYLDDVVRTWDLDILQNLFFTTTYCCAESQPYNTKFIQRIMIKLYFLINHYVPIRYGVRYIPKYSYIIASIWSVVCAIDEVTRDSTAAQTHRFRTSSNKFRVYELTPMSEKLREANDSGIVLTHYKVKSYQPLKEQYSMINDVPTFPKINHRLINKHFLEETQSIDGITHNNDINIFSNDKYSIYNSRLSIAKRKVKVC